MKKKSVVTTIADSLCWVEKNVTWIFFFIMLCLLMIQVVCRYYLHLPLAWAEEMLRFIYIGVSFSGAVIAVRERGHIEINILPVIVKLFAKTEAGQKKVLAAVDIIIYMIGIGFWAYITYIMYVYMFEVKEQGQLSTAMQIPMYFVVMAIVIPSALCSLHYLLNVIESLQSFGKSSEEVSE